MAPKRPKGVDVFPKVVENASPMSPEVKQSELSQNTVKKN